MSGLTFPLVFPETFTPYSPPVGTTGVALTNTQGNTRADTTLSGRTTASTRVQGETSAENYDQ